LCTQPNGFNRQVPSGNIAGKKTVNPRFAFKTLQLIATGVSLTGPGDALPVDVLDDELVACGATEAASFINVSSGLLLHQGSPDSAIDCAEEPAPDVFPPNNPEQPTNKTLISNTARESQDRLTNRETLRYLLIHRHPYTKRDLRIIGMKNCSLDIDICL
jgi:hypothetical protein